jgi:hypothetical protein
LQYAQTIWRAWLNSENYEICGHYGIPIIDIDRIERGRSGRKDVTPDQPTETYVHGLVGAEICSWRGIDGAIIDCEQALNSSSNSYTSENGGRLIQRPDTPREAVSNWILRLSGLCKERQAAEQREDKDTFRCKNDFEFSVHKVSFDEKVA